MSTPPRTRREVVRSLGIGAAAVVASPWLGPTRAATGKPAPQRFRIGYQIFSWSRNFPAAWWKGAAAVGSLGFRGIEGEYTIAELYEGRESEFDDGMTRCGVSLAALYSTTDLERRHEHQENVRKNLRAAAFAKRAGCRMLVIGGTEAKSRDAELFAVYAKAANEIGQRVLETHGVRVGVHPHVGSLVESREQIARVMDATDPRYFWLAPDTGHLLAGGSDPVEVFRVYKDRIAHAHLKDYQPAAAPGARGAFLVLGKGVIDFGALLRLLPASFDGWLDVEMDGRGDPLEIAKEAKQYLTGRLGLSLEPPAPGGRA